MGVYYFYVNHSKKELFPVDCLGGAIKRGGIGRALGARAFALMLDELHGRWANDNIAVIGDDTHSDWTALEENYVDVTANAILAVSAEDGMDEILDVATQYDSVFMQLCHMITTGQAPGFRDEFVARFGASFATKYKKLCKERSWWNPTDIVAEHSS